jgi:ADP-ribose pyrophosphatase YjhB (NUDIX family)
MEICAREGFGWKMTMPRVQAIVVRGNSVLMVKHRQDGQEWWCLPGGAQEPNETPEQGALRELREECNVCGVVVRQTSHVWHSAIDEAYSFLVDIGDQCPSLGSDPDVETGSEVLADVRWLQLCDIPERDRVFLWASGLVGTGPFLREIESWGNDTSYPEKQSLKGAGEATP